MNNFKYKYYRLPPYGTAIGDIGYYIGFKDAENIIVREKIDLDGGIFSNTGKGEYTFVEFAGHGVNETIDGVNLYGDGSLYIKRKDLKPTLPFGKEEEEFQKQIEEYIQSKKSFNERKEIKLSLEEKLKSENKTLQEKLDIAVNALTTIINACEIKHPKNGINSVRPEHMFIDSIQNTAQEALEKIKEIK